MTKEIYIATVKKLEKTCKDTARPLLVTFLEDVSLSLSLTLSHLSLSLVPLALSPMSMTALLRLAVTLRVNKSRLSVSRSSEWRFHTKVERAHNVCIRIIFYATLYHANNARVILGCEYPDPRTPLTSAHYVARYTGALQDLPLINKKINFLSRIYMCKTYHYPNDTMI